MTALSAHGSGASSTIPAQGGGQITRQLTARDFTVSAEDLQLTLTTGSVFPVDTADGVAALVLIGRGVMRFSPAPEAEQTQVRIFSGATTTLESRFDAAFVWFGRVELHADLSRLATRKVDSRELQQALAVLREEAGKTLVFEAGAKTIPPITRLPDASDFIAEVRTPRFGTLTYLRSEATPENITLFERSSQKTIALYPSKERLAARGRFFNEDESAQYDVLHHDLDVSYVPDKHAIDGRADMRLRILSPATNRIPMRLAETLNIRAITSPEAGRLSATRVGTRDAVMVDFPTALQRNTELTVSIEYGGTVEPFFPEWEMPRQAGKAPSIPIQAAYLNSMFPIWYPRPPTIDYATLAMRVKVPAAFDCIGTGELAPGSPAVGTGEPSQRTKTFVFVAGQPVRHAAFLATPLELAHRETLTPEVQKTDASASVVLNVFAHPRIIAEARAFAASTAAIVRFFYGIVGEFPFTTFTTALLEGEIPGGHSAGYFSVVGWPPKNTPRRWQNDPAAFDLFPGFITAHEVAHQWWGQAVGWNGYHDQWFTEAFTQYFAALYVAHQSGDPAFREILIRMRKFALDEADEGPLSLGHRLGSLRGEDHVFRAILYNKGPAVLHMLRRFIGDESFFRGVRRFYVTGRFRKPGTDDLRRAMEAESGRSLERFFERWVYGSALPQLRFSYRVEAAPNGVREALLRLDQTGELFDVPITAVLHYTDKPPIEIIIPVSDRLTEKRVALTGALRKVEIRTDDGILAEIRGI